MRVLVRSRNVVLQGLGLPTINDRDGFVAMIG